MEAAFYFVGYFKTMTEPLPPKRPERKRPLPLRRFEDFAEDEEQESVAKEEVDTDKLPSYLRRRAPTGEGNRLVLVSLGLTFGLFVVGVAAAYLFAPPPIPVIPVGTSVDRGLSVLASPPGYTAALLKTGGANNLLTSSDTDRDGFVWFKTIPSKGLPPGNYLLELSAPGYTAKRIPVTLVEGRPLKLSYTTQTALQKAES